MPRNRGTREERRQRRHDKRARVAAARAVRDAWLTEQGINVAVLSHAQRDHEARLLGGAKAWDLLMERLRVKEAAS